MSSVFSVVSLLHPFALALRAALRQTPKVILVGDVMEESSSDSAAPALQEQKPSGT